VGVGATVQKGWGVIAADGRGLRIGHGCAGVVTGESGETLNPVNGPVRLRCSRRRVLPFDNEKGSHRDQQRDNDCRADPVKREFPAPFITALLRFQFRNDQLPTSFA